MLACILFVFAALAEYAALLAHKSKVSLPRGDEREGEGGVELIKPAGVDEWGVVRLFTELALPFLASKVKGEGVGEKLC